ncbi:MAG: type II secretion system protein [Fimbriimonadaceae bacterium]|nr:type II secretion system protein [Fimbriimonadaceae bacterium]
MHRHHALTRRDAGQTLVEMLTAIAVVTALSAIILPAFANSRRQALVTTEISNLHQAGIGYALYAGDHDGVHIHTTRQLAELKYIQPAILSSELDPTPEGISNVVAAQLRKSLPHCDKPTTYRSSFLSFGQYVCGLESFDEFGERRAAGWLVSVSQTTPGMAAGYLVGVNGTYHRLLTDGAVVVRQTDWLRLKDDPELGTGTVLAWKWLFADRSKDEKLKDAR